jgi:hypothetical protein
LRRRAAVLTAMAAVSTSVVPFAAAANGPKVAPAIYLVGGATESINPTDAMLAGKDFYLGGYGFGDGKVGNVVGVPGVTDALGNRFATGILGDGVHTRAFLVSDRKSSMVFAQIETQGYFDAYKQGPFGLNEIRKDASAEIQSLAGDGGAPAPTASQIVVDSDHSHGGPDTVGVWGGVPTSYLKLVHDRTVQAIVEAWQRARPATLSYGVVHAGVEGESAYQPTDGQDWLLTNQFSYDVHNQAMDDEVRVLQAHDPHNNKVLATYVNFPAHPTVLGSDNTRVTGDYVGRLDLAMEQEFGGFAMDQVATLGREQPARTGCPTSTAGDSDPAEALCALDTYAQRVLAKVKEAASVAQPVAGRPLVAMNSYLLQDPATAPPLVAATFAGAAIGAPIARAGNPPWFTGNVISTSYYVGRIGDILVTGGPGEMYAQIWQKVRETVPGMQGYINVGTAGDFLGYIIAPLEAYPEPVRRSLFDGQPPPQGNNCSGVDSPLGCPSPIDNDNYLFNGSHTFGERLTCDFLRGAGDILANDPSKFWTSYNRCPAFANDFLTPPGADMKFPEQPDLSAVLTHL